MDTVYGSDLNDIVASYRVADDAVYVGCNRERHVREFSPSASCCECVVPSNRNSSLCCVHLQQRHKVTRRPFAHVSSSCIDSRLRVQSYDGNAPSREFLHHLIRQQLSWSSGCNTDAAYSGSRRPESRLWDGISWQKDVVDAQFLKKRDQNGRRA
jgi:hypothetical protein